MFWDKKELAQERRNIWADLIATAVPFTIEYEVKE
jgi:hypothetical protein